MTPDAFSQLFAVAFAAQDATALAEMLAEVADVVTLTGAVAETRLEAKQAFDQEFAGIFVKSRLVSGRMRLRPLGPGGAVVHQRFVVFGARDANGQEMQRFGASLTAVLLARTEGWHAVSLTFSALT